MNASTGGTFPKAMGKSNPREKARERQEALEEQRGREKAAAAERAEAEAWRDGADARGSKRKEGKQE